MSTSSECLHEISTSFTMLMQGVAGKKPVTTNAAIALHDVVKS
ncbi:MAG TPA: hypothetical protein VJW73_04060 [Gemmatimonadaceae bacterium]|nr:hypothetical protein [Gemmatimonadaceae bacterium]